MITREQALNLKHGQIIKQVKAYRPHKGSNFPFNWSDSDLMADDLSSSVNWRINGKVQTWKTRPNEFKVPIKHGLYKSGYLTHENNHLFELEG